MFKIVFLKNERNDATDYYVNLIKKTIEVNGYSVDIINDVREIKKNDIVLTITLKAFFLTWLRNPRQFIIHWFQGISPEEALILFKDSWKKNLKWLYLSLFEKFTLKLSRFNFFVSEAMLQHYKKKYNYSKRNYMIMPCYNQALNDSAFHDNKYSDPTFVYAGSMSEWQCVVETLLVFKEFQSQCNRAKLYLYTADHDKALQYIKEMNLNNVIVDYVSYENLNDKLKNIKYGFLIRENHIVNNVSTPTKMNGYLASGIIPIYTEVIFDFNINIDGFYKISSLDYKGLANFICDFELKKIRSENVLIEYRKYFNKYYCDTYYTNKIVLNFKKFGIF